MKKRKFNFLFLRKEEKHWNCYMPFNKISKAHSFQAVFKMTEFQHKEIIDLEFIFIGFLDL